MDKLRGVEVMVNWVDVTTLDQASKGIKVEANAITGDKRFERKVIQIEPVQDEHGVWWRQLRCMTPEDDQESLVAVEDGIYKIISK